jgi:hypothetical protein
MPNVTVSQPPQNGTVHALQPFLVSGRASGDVEVEIHPIDSVTVQVDDGPVVEAVTTLIAGSVPPAVLFKAFAEVGHGADPHLVRVVATNDTAQKAHTTVDVFTGPIFRTSPAAILLEVSLPLAVAPGDPKLHAMVGRVQHSLLPLSRALGSIGKVLVGPNLVATIGPNGPGLRFGLWIEDGDFPVMAAQPPDFPLPQLLPAAEGPCFNATPGLSVPPPRGLSPGFALGIPEQTLQRLLDAVAPGVKAAAAQQDVRLDTLIALVMAPGSVTTSFSGEGDLLGIGVPFTVSVTEAIGLKAATSGGSAVPAVLGTSHSSSVGSVLEWLVSLVIPVFNIALLVAWGVASSTAGEISDRVNGVMAPLLAGIPTRFPFRNTDLPIPSAPDFPALELTWLSFGVTGSTVVGTGTADVVARSQADAALSTTGASTITGYQADLAGGAGQGYQFHLIDLTPDAGAFTWSVTGTGTDAGPIDDPPFTQIGSIDVNFPLSLHVAAGTYLFQLTVSATETCGTDPSKTLHATASRPVKVNVKPNPKIQP